MRPMIAPAFAFLREAGGHYVEAMRVLKHIVLAGSIILSALSHHPLCVRERLLINHLAWFVIEEPV